MYRVNRNNIDIDKDLTAVSDNTRVSSPYRIQQKVESTQNRPKIDVKESVERLRKQREEQDRINRIAAEKAQREEEASRAEEERKREIEKYHQRKLQEKQEAYEKEKANRERQTQEELKKSEESYEPDYNRWLEDVQKNPNNYSSTTKEVVKRAMHSYKHPNDYLARLDRGIARALFGIKNAVGKTALSSIDTNGTSILGELSLTEYKQEALKYHDWSVQLQLSLNDLDNERKSLALKYNVDSEYAALNPNDPTVQMFNKEYQELTGQMNGIKQLLNDPQLKQFDDAYKQLYTVDKEGFWSSIGRAYRNAISANTYDQYKDYVMQRDRQRDIDNYNKILAQQDYKNNVGYAPFLAKPLGVIGDNNAPKDVSQYTKEELLNIDATETAKRLKELAEERKGYLKEYEENRKHFLDSTKYWDVSKYYEHGIKAHQYDDLWNMGYVWYELPLMIGSTYSSPEQGISSALSATSIAGYASSPWTGGLGTAVGIGADALAFPFQIRSGYKENWAENGDRRIDQFTEILGGRDSDPYKNIVAEAKQRSRMYWKARGMDEKSIDKYLEGEEGERSAIKDLMMGLLDHMVDKNGKPYVKDKNGHALYVNPITVPELFKARLYSTQGLQAQFDANNMRTMAGTFFEKALTLTPQKWIKKAASATFNKATDRWIVDTAEDIASDAAGRVTARAASKTAGKKAANEAVRETYNNGFRKETFAETFAKGANRGAAVMESAGFGFPGQIIGYIGGGTVNTAMRIGLSKLSPAARSAYRTIEEGILHKYQALYDKLLPNNKFARAAAIFGGKTARATFASLMSEMAEEAVQYLNSKEDFASKYGWGGMSIGDMIVNDIYQGARVFDAYMSLFGLSNSELLNDAEFWANAKGGFALGGLHTGLMRAAIEGAEAYKEYRIHSSILTSGVMNREVDNKDRAANVEFARQAMKKRTGETLAVLDWMQKNDSRRENPYFTQEDYDEKISAANTISALTNNKRIREGLEAKGIVYGTEQYANAIADIYSTNKQLQDNFLESREKENNINQLWNSKEYQDEADKIVEARRASSFEEYIGRGSAIIEAGNKAVSEETKRAKEAGENTETSDFKKHLQNVRKDAQEAAAFNIDANARQEVIGMSHTAHKLQSLIKLRAQHNTITDFFTFLKDKFNLNPKRPDAKLIVKNVDEQIELAKQDLAKFDSDFDIHMTDAAILDYIKTLPIVNAHSNDIERHEIASAMLQADRAVINKHAQMFEFGLVRNKDGKLEYNPAAYKARQQKRNQLNEDLKAGKITLEEYTTKMDEPQELPEYNAADVENNPYKRRIQAIIDTRKDNQALNWMINDIENGDGVTKILDEIAEEEYKEDTSEAKKAKAKEESESFSFEFTEPETPITVTPEVEVKSTPKEKYERRKAGAKEKYQNRKKTLRDLRKRAYATFVPIPTPILDIANALITKAEIATYKIAQFAEELKAIADKLGYNANSFLSGIKAFYIDKLVSVLATNPQLADNFSSTQEIVSFDFGDVVVQQPIVFGSAESIQQQINDDADAIDNDLSTHYDIIVKNGDTVVVYPNKEAIVNARFDSNAYRKDTIKRLTDANTSDESFRNALREEFANYQDQQVPIEKYVKYRNVDGIIEAIANRRWNQENELSVQFGKLMRNTVLAIMFNTEDQLDQSIVSDPDTYAEFRKQVINAYNKITSKENGMGLTIIDCNRAIYGTDYNGNNISSEADIIATDGNKLYAIDIRYSFQSLRENWNHKYERATFTINEHVTRRLKLIEQIINTKFKRGVNGLYCLGVVYDPKYNILTIDIEDGNYFIPVKAETQDEHYETIDESKTTAEQFVNEINKNISEYNALVDEVQRYVDGYSRLDHISLQSFESVQEYVDYLNQLHASYDNLIDRINDVKTIIDQNRNIYNEIWSSDQNRNISEQNPTDIQQQYVRLREICADLDLVLDEIPSLKVTTEAERQNVDKLIETIFDAQFILDQLLSNKDAADLNLRAEQELITVALEKMAQNKDNFGKASMFVRQWWATKLAVGESDNTTDSVKTISDIYFGYINKIQSWIDTLENHVLSDLADHYDLQEWYSAVLNNYFSKLLDNAERFTANNITDVGQRAAINMSIKYGRDLINQFNGLWDTRPEENFDGPIVSPEVDKINRLPVRWMDKWAWSESIMPAFDQMTDKNYYWLSLSPTFLDSEFTLYVDNNGKLRLTIDGKDRNGYAKHVDIGFENDLSKAKTDIDRWEYVNNARQKFIRKAIAAINFVKANPGYEIKFDKSTNKGQILYRQDGELKPVTNFIFNDPLNQHDLYTIKLSKKDRIGMLVTLKGDQIGPDVYSVKGGNNLIEDIGGFDRDYVKLVLNTQSGAVVYFYNTGNDQYIGTPIQSTNIGEDAPKLVYLMQKYMEGNRVDQYGFDIMELLKMRLYMADPQRRLSFRNNTANMITLGNNTITIGNEEFDIISQKNELIRRVAQMNNVTRADMMNESLRTSENSVISRVRTLFGQGGQPSMQLTNGLTFDLEDFTHKNNDPDSQDGSTWLGYMLRNNLLGSSANTLGYKELRISNLRVLPKGFVEEKTIPQEIKQAEQQKPKVVVKADDFFNKLRGLTKVSDESQINANRSVEEQEGFVNDVLEYFDTVLGINGQVTFGPIDKKFLMEISKNERVIGICTEQMIILSKYAPMSVAWHEAFHKIFELVIPAEERDAFYNAYTHSIYGRITKPSDRDIAEAFADMFMTYMQNKQALNKADTFFKKAKAWFKSFAFNIGMNFKIGRQKSKEMYELYHKMNAGEYKDTKITPEQNERFKRLFSGSELYYKVTNIDTKATADFSHISDVGEKDKLVRSLAYYILKAYDIDGLNPKVARVKISGGTSNIKATPQRLEEMYDGAIVEYLKNQHPVFEEIFEKVEKEYTDDKGNVRTYNYYPKFDALSRDIADYISTIFDTMRKPKIEDDDSDDSDTQNQTGEAEDFMAKDTDHWDKAAYEFSKLDGLMDEVKLFFGTIPYGKYVDEVDNNGNAVRTVQVDYNRNVFGTPEFMPINDVYQLIVKNFFYVQSIEELDKELEKYSTVKEVYAQVYQKFHELVYGQDEQHNGIYKKNENGEIIVALTNFNRESKALAILSAILSLKLNFLVALSSKQKDEDAEGKSTRIVESSLDRDSKSYPDQWNQYLVSGQIGVFQRERGEGFQIDAQGNRKKTVLLFREGMGGKNGTDIFSRTAKFFQDLRSALLSNNTSFSVDGIDYNSNVFDDINRIKDEIVHRLCTIGIMFERDALDYMLAELYGGVDAEALTRFLTDSPASTDQQVQEDAKKSTITAFIDRLNQYVTDGGVIKQDLVENEGYGSIGFVGKLAKYQGQYKRMSTQSMALALNGKKLFTISLNNTISHIIKQLNTFDLLNETVKTLSGFGYNITRNEAGLPIGSIILKAIQERKPIKMEGFTYIGFKTDNRGDQGSEYTDESTIEDYIAKMTMLQQGYLIFPTLADKSTWMLASGVPIPGMRFIESKNDNDQIITTVTDAPTVRIFNGKPYLVPNDKVLDQMIEYAKCELLGIQQCMEDLGYEDIPGYQKQGRTKLTESLKILNYHTANGSIEPNGTRFLSLTKVVVNEYNDKTGKYELVTYNLNDPRESSVTLLKRAQDVFFARREGETTEEMIARQREIMALTLAIQTQHEVNTAVDLGIVKRISYSAKFGEKNVTISNTDQSLQNLESKDLNISLIRALQSYFMRTTMTKDGTAWSKILDSDKHAFYSKTARSLAIAAILQDATLRHIICSQEVQRCFSGHPALFKVKYSKTGIKDSAYDIQKRIGGMVSTGEDNILNVPGIKSDYVCAECEDYEVASKSNVANRLEQLFSDSQARHVFGLKTGLWDDAYNLTIDQLKEKYPNYSKLIDDQQAEGAKYAKSFTGGINVADGSSFITADMCRDMLRMRGAYNNRVRKAFKILMSSTKYDWVKSVDAYKIVYGALNIVPTKYTAYGFRPHTLNGEQVSDVAVAYYDKFALFPIFPCMATGKMAAVYDKMDKEKVDMLLMTSAVKVGSQGAVSFDGESISDPFNKYTQSYAYLRRQLNTDPEEKDELAIGTQMMKIGLSNLVKDRMYVDLDGNKVSGKQLLNDFMGSINQLAKIGAEQLKDMFFDSVTDEDGVTTQTINYEKVSEYLKDQLSSRNANKTLIQSIQVVTDPVTGAKKLATPLAATTDAQWIESIFISTMNKKVVDINIPGNSFIQHSVFAMEGDNFIDNKLNKGEKLQMINEDGSMDVVISIDYFDKILPRGLSFEQSKQWLIDQGIISGYRTNDEDMSQSWYNAKANMIGYRIPTQAQSSIHALRIVDILPAAKNTIIVPEEFTKITGSDFDIDHLYLASFNFNKDDNGNITTLYEEGTVEYYQNKILSCLLTLLKDTENSLNQLYKPIDNDTELVTNVSDFIPESGSTKGDPYNFGTLHEQVIRKNDYITGKKGIGPFALNSTGHMLCRQYGVKFRESNLVNNTRLQYMDTVLDKDDNFVSAWLSGFINAHVDIVKDPYISRLNVNPFTYNMLNLMIRCGWGDTALWFLANPVIRSMADANNLADSQYMKRTNTNKSGRTYRQLLIYDAVAKYLDESEISEQVITDLLNSKNRASDRSHIVNWLENNKNLLQDAAISGNVDHNTAKMVFYAWKILEKYSIALGDLVQHTKVDTRKYGKNFMALARYYDEFLDIFHADPTTGLWDVSGLQKLEYGSWIGTKTYLVASLPKLVFGGLTFNANDRFVDAVTKFAHTLEYDGKKLSLDDVVNLAKHLQTAIKSKYFVGYARDVLKMSDKDIADLFIGYKSMNRQLVSLKDLISNNPEYKRLENNPFLNQIYSMLEDKPVFANGRDISDRPGFVTVLDNVDDSKLNSDLLSEGWLALMNDQDARVRKFAKKFVVYAFLTSGEFKGWNKMLKYVPYEWIAGQVDPQYQSYSDFIEQELLNVSNDYSDLYDDVVANNFMDYRFAAQMEEKNDDNTKNFLNDDRGVRIGKGVKFDQLDMIAEYISIRKPGMRSGNQDSYDLFKLIDTVKVGKEYYPVYAKIKKRGYHTRGNDIYEYGWDFNYAENERKGSDTFDYDGAIKRVQEYVNSGALTGFSEANILAVNKVYTKPDTDQQVAPKAKTIEPGAHIATRGYRKGDPLKHPNFNYVFTENAQAYIASGNGEQFDLGVPTSKDHVKLNVSDVNGTNQAGIRTDLSDNITPNAYGIIVKKFQQNADGKFVAQAGTFLDTEEDFDIFTKLNEDMFNRLEQSSNDIIIFPSQMALGKAALPKRFAEWLRNQLLDRFGIISNVVKNERNDYEGYGLLIERVEPKESNLLQDRNYDWKYEEDSGYSGVLEELGLPEKVRMNGGMTYRPHYDFGRIYLTDNERIFINEEITATIDGHDYLPDDIAEISKFHNRNMFNINSFGELPKDDKDKIAIPNEYKDLIDDLFDHGFIDEHDFDESGKKISKRAVNFMGFLRKYDIAYVMDDLAVIRNQLDMTNRELFDSSFEDIVYNYMVSLQEENLIGETDNISYSYSDSRQQELFSDEDFDPSFREHCKN